MLLHRVVWARRDLSLAGDNHGPNKEASTEPNALFNGMTSSKQDRERKNKRQKRQKKSVQTIYAWKFTLLMNLHIFVAEPVNPVHIFHDAHCVFLVDLRPHRDVFQCLSTRLRRIRQRPAGLFELRPFLTWANKHLKETLFDSDQKNNVSRRIMTQKTMRKTNTKKEETTKKDTGGQTI